MSAHAADSLRFYSETIEVRHLDLVGTIPGIRPLAVAARCGPGVARLRANASGTAIAFRAPGSTIWGPWVAAPIDGEYLLPDGTDRDAWLRVYVHSAYLPARPAEAILHLADLFSNAIASADIDAAGAAAGDVETYTVGLVNESTTTLTRVLVWLDAIAENLELSPDGSTWSTPTDEAAGVILGDISPGGSIDCHVRRTISPGSASDAGVLNLLHFAFNGL